MICRIRLERRSLKILIVLVFLVLAGSVSEAADFYVDARKGNDSAKGTRRRPWQTVARVNQAELPPGATVHFKAGRSYGPTVLMARSGSQGARVSYTSYGKGSKPKLAGLDATGKSHVKASGLSLSAAATVVNLTGATHVTVDGCEIECSARGWAPAVTIQDNARYNRITNNTMTQSEGKNDTINLRGNADYNLIEGNRITISGIHCAIGLEGHSGRGSADYNIIRNNVITGRKGGGALIGVQANSNHNLIEGNLLSGDRTMEEHCGSNQHARHQTMLKVVSMHNIVRNNVIKNYPCADSLGLDLSAYHYDGFSNIASGNHIYNNVITGVSAGGTPLYLGENGTGGKSVNNIFKNNIIYNNGGTWYRTNSDGDWPRSSAQQQMKVQVSLNVRENLFINNIFYKSDESRIMWVNNAYVTVAQAESWKPELFRGNLQIDPRLDPLSQRPLPGSPVRDAGAWLTTVTTSSGSGAVLQVEDAYYFQAGSDLAAGDAVQINDQIVALKGIDYASNTLTLARPVSWSQGDPVNLPYYGAAPDIGAFESASPGTAPPAAAGPNQLRQVER